MIDAFSLLLSHGLIGLAVWRLLSRPDLDDEDAGATAPEQCGWLPQRKQEPPVA
jgi:hypothetical protein